MNKILTFTLKCTKTKHKIKNTMEKLEKTVLEPFTDEDEADDVFDDAPTREGRSNTSLRGKRGVGHGLSRSFRSTSYKEGNKLILECKEQIETWTEFRRKWSKKRRSLKQRYK